MDIKNIIDMWQELGIPAVFVLFFFVGRSYYLTSSRCIEQLEKVIKALKDDVDSLNSKVGISEEKIEKLEALLHGANSKKTILHRIICRHKTCEHYRSTDNCPVAKEYKDGGHDDEME